jgi:exo-1,4-beta-D-glucosaminidase
MNKLTAFTLSLSIMSMTISSCKKSNSPSALELKSNWTIQSEDKIDASGAEISSKNFSTSNWHSVSIPNTILAGLVEAKVYTDIYKDRNLEKIDKSQFNQPWWYRTQFNVEQKQFHKLILEGINYRANIWLNGAPIADSSKIKGAFGIWEIDITNHIAQGKNALAIQVFPPKYNDLTIGFVDWNPSPPDKNLGIWRPVKIVTTGAVSIDEPFVNTIVNTETLAEAELIISTHVTNNSDVIKRVTIHGQIKDIIVEKSIELKPNEAKKVIFNPSEFAQLKIKNPKLWWPNLMGEQNLHTLKMYAAIDNNISDSKEVRFGIRKVEDYWTTEGHKGYKVNGKKVLIKGAGWVDDILLADTDEKVIAQMEYVKHMNMNCVRLEGFWGRNKTLYEKADELGLLLMIGWSCHWEWEGYCGREEDEYMCIRTPEDMELQSRAFQDQVIWLRNHPSIFTWVYGSDKLPLPELESLLNKYIGEVDNSRPILVSCKGSDFDLVEDENGKITQGYSNVSQISGPSGVKMLGPYAYTAPSYWYLDKNAVGAYGFNTETGPGPQIPPIESIEKMISADSLWPLNDVWNYHSGRNEFSTLSRYLKAFNARYGEANSADDFAYSSQLSNYEAIRAMFEAFEVNKPRSTGVVQWMLNSAWPEMFWQLYDWYLMPNGAFYGTKTACQPLNAIYNYGDKNIYLSNDLPKEFENLNIEATVFDINSNIVFNKTEKVSINEISSKKVIDLPDFSSISSTYFLKLKVTDNNSELASNFYWLSTKPDVHDWENSQWFYTPYKSYADLKQLNKLEKTTIASSFTSSTNENGEIIVSCDLNNPSDKIAFFIELSIKDKATGETILPVFWDDNYVSLLPGEKRTVSAKLQQAYVKNKELSFHIQGINTK